MKKIFLSSLIFLNCCTASLFASDWTTLNQRQETKSSVDVTDAGVFGGLIDLLEKMDKWIQKNVW